MLLQSAEDPGTSLRQLVLVGLDKWVFDVHRSYPSLRRTSPEASDESVCLNNRRGLLPGVKTDISILPAATTLAL